MARGSPMASMTKERTMNRKGLAVIGVMVLLQSAGLLWTTDLRGQSIVDYSSNPPFIPNVSAPNVLLIMDNSGSMACRAYDNATNCNNFNANGLVPFNANTQ